MCAYLHTVVSAQARVGSVCMRAAAYCTITGRMLVFALNCSAGIRTVVHCSILYSFIQSH